MMNDIFGSDILLNDNLEVMLSSNGELQLVNGTNTVFQDIKLRLLTKKGTLFYNEDYGSNLPDFIMDDSIDETSLVSEIIRTVESDARVEPYSVKVNILKNETGKIEAEITYQLIGYDTDINEVISIDRNIWSSNNEI